MAAFTTWAAELQRFKDAVASRDSESLLQSGYTNSQGQSVTFSGLDAIQRHIEFLEGKASQESNSGGRRSGFFTCGYRSR